MAHGTNTLLLAALAVIGGAGLARAAVPAAEAAKLKTELTPFGAERAGSADGAIPAWTGGVAPATAADQAVPNLFGGEKPLFTITAATAAKYADKLNDGTKALFAKYPDYRMEVYQSHRTAVAPQWVYDNTFANATSATTTNDGYSVQGAYGGIPFPIPKTGTEAMWNHLLRWEGQANIMHISGYTVPTDGNPVLQLRGVQDNQYPYYFKRARETGFDGDFWEARQFQTGPALLDGGQVLLHDPLDQVGRGRQGWQYLPGQRRTRRAPLMSYDTPDQLTSGIGNWDEGYVFEGPMDRYDWKLVGKREMFIPYNTNRFALAKFSSILGPHFLNPDELRWEPHRVWVVEATVRQGKRHVVPKRVFYLDEDTWACVQADGWDAEGHLWKHYFSSPVVVPAVPAVMGEVGFGIYDLRSGIYYITNAINEQEQPIKVVEPWSPDHFTPDALAASGQY